MSQVRVHNFSVSLDGFGAGAGQSPEAPFGHAGTRRHEWFFPTRSFRVMQGHRGVGKPGPVAAKSKSTQIAESV